MEEYLKRAREIIDDYEEALDLLDGYDHQRVEKPEGREEGSRLSYEECRAIIDNMSYGSSSALFGNEKDDSFKGSIGDIYQTFAGVDVYPTVEEKAANLLYFIVKNHSFSDGNKRIAAVVFLYFLDKNSLLYDEKGKKKVDDGALVSLTIMLACSRPQDKEIMINLVMNFIK